MIQTGEEQQPTVQIAIAEASPLAPTASEIPALAPPAPGTDKIVPETPEPRLAAFAFAAGMGATVRPNTQSPSTSKQVLSTANASGCHITSASYGGKKALLIRTGAAPAERYTVLTVLEGFEKSMLANYLKAHAPEGESVGEFATREEALSKAKELCPGGATASPRNTGTRTG